MQGIQPPFFDKLKMNTKFLIMKDDLNFVTEVRKAEPADHPRVQPPGKEVSTLILPDVLQREVNIELYCVHHYRFVDVLDGNKCHQSSSNLCDNLYFPPVMLN